MEALSVVCKYVHSKLDFGCFFLVVSSWMYILGPSLCGQGQGSAWFITLRVSFQIYNLVKAGSSPCPLHQILVNNRNELPNKIDGTIILLEGNHGL